MANDFEIWWLGLMTLKFDVNDTLKTIVDLRGYWKMEYDRYDLTLWKTLDKFMH